MRHSQTGITFGEAEVQESIVDGLRALGYKVWKTQPRGVWSGGRRHGTGVDPGIPDLLVGREEWGAVRLALEVKGTKTPLSKEQKELYEADMIVVARSWEDARDAVDALEAKYGFKRVMSRVRPR